MFSFRKRSGDGGNFQHTSQQVVVIQNSSFCHRSQAFCAQGHHPGIGTYKFFEWWIAAAPGMAIFTAVMGFNFLGDGLRDLLDPRLSR